MNRADIRKQPIDAAGGILYRVVKESPEILLIFRRGVWDLPKGKRETDESFEECAIREVSEETGVTGLKLKGYLADTSHEYEQDGIRYSKKTKWYSMEAANPFAGLRPQQEEAIEKLLWVPVAEAKRKVEFDNLRRVITVFQGKIAGENDGG